MITPNPQHTLAAVDITAVGALGSVPLWWPLVNAYGQIILLIFGLAIGALRLALLIRDWKKK